MTAHSLLTGSPYQGYLYSYPHKTAYREVAPRSLGEVWSSEPKERLFLYLHVPFCRVRCGFCNLLATAKQDDELVERWLSQLELEARAVAGALGPGRRFSRAAVGGGTPSYLGERDIERLIAIQECLALAPASELPTSFEVSPDTLTREKSRVLLRAGVTRVSMGIQSFDERDVKALGRPQQTASVSAALDLLKSSGFPQLNLDLIYGGENQTLSSWEASLQAALRFEPEQLYLYPLYVRRLTGLGRRDRRWEDQRLSQYRLGRELLLSRGYEQRSMRCFEKPDVSAEGPPYRCQEDSMVGLGIGARSYTRELHYSSEYGVGSQRVMGLIESYCGRSADDLAQVVYGYELDAAEHQRRTLILSLLEAPGFSRAEFSRQLGADALELFPELLELQSLELVTVTPEHISLTTAGLERSDAVGPWLVSERVRERMGSYQWS